MKLVNFVNGLTQRTSQWLLINVEAEKHVRFLIIHVSEDPPTEGKDRMTEKH